MGKKKYIMNVEGRASNTMKLKNLSKKLMVGNFFYSDLIVLQIIDYSFFRL
jgi:hypothetical protein